MKNELMINVPSIGDMTSAIEERIFNGCVDTIDAYTQLTRIKKVVDNVLDNDRVKEMVFGRLAEGNQTSNNVELSIAESGVRYDYASCGHYHYNELLAQKKAIEEEMKSIEKMLKNIEGEIADAYTGEILSAPKKTAKQTIKCKMAD